MNEDIFTLDERYEFDPVEDLLGEGRYGRVFKARNLYIDDVVPDERVALKIFKEELTEDIDVQKRLKHEANKMRSIKHLNIARVYDVKATLAGDQYYMVMQYIEGEDLDTVIKRKPLSWPQARLVITCVAEALFHLHEHGFLHGDIKPSNIMLDKYGDAYLIDMGMTRIVGADRAQQSYSFSATPGTPFYMAPEIWMDFNDASPQSDIYAFAATVYEILTGTTLIDVELDPEATNYAPGPFIEAHRHRAVNVDALTYSDAPATVANVLLKAVTKSPQNRYPTADAFLQALLGNPGFQDRNAPWIYDVPRNADVNGVWAAMVQVGQINDLLIQGSYTYAATDAGLVRWEHSRGHLFTATDGLADSNVLSLTTDRAGNLWIGTKGGLCYGNIPPFSCIPALTGVAINDLVTVDDGTIWAATSKGLIHINDRGGIVRSGGQPESLPKEPITCIYLEDKYPDYLWVGTRHGFVRLVSKHSGWATDKTIPEGDFDLLSVSGITGTDDGNIWLNTSSGIAVLKGRTWSFPEWGSTSALGTIHHIEGIGGELWIATDQGLYVTTGHGQHLEALQLEQDLKQVRVIEARNRFDILVADGKRLLSIQSGRTDVFERHYVPPAPKGNMLNALLADGHGGIYVGSRQGLSYWNGRTFITVEYADNQYRQAGWVTGLALNQYDNTPWLLTNPGGVWTNRLGQWEKIKFPANEKEFNAIYIDTSGWVWVGTSKGIYYIPPSSGRPEKIYEIPDAVLSITGMGEKILFGTQQHGVLSIQTPFNKGDEIQTVGNNSPGVVSSLAYSADDGSIWAGTSYGINRLVNNQWETRPELNSIRTQCLYLSNDRALWIGTMDNGIARYDGRHVRWFSREGALPQTSVTAMLETQDGSGIFWFATLGGLVRFIPD